MPCAGVALALPAFRRQTTHNIPTHLPQALAAATAPAKRKPSGSRVAWPAVAICLMAALAISYLSIHFQNRSMDMLEWENRLLERQVGQRELQIERRLRSLGFDWDNYSKELPPDSSRRYLAFRWPARAERQHGRGRLDPH